MSGNAVTIVASLVRLTPRPMATRCITVSRPTSIFSTLGVCPRSAGCLIKLVKRIASLLKESSAGVGSSHASGVPFEQRHAEFVFERPHSAAQYRLPNAQRLCGAPEALMLSDGKRLRNRNRVNPG